MHLGYNTNGFAHHRLEDTLRILAELGYKSVALTLDYHALNPFDSKLQDQVVSIRALLRDLDLRCVIETGSRYLLDPRHKHQPTLISPDAVGRARRLDFLSRAVNLAAVLGADAVSFWSGAAVDDAPHDELMERLVESIRKLCSYAGGRSVRMAFEPEPGMFIDSMPAYAELTGRINSPFFGLTLDIGHLHCMGETDLATQIVLWGDRLWNVHLEDMRRGVHEHLMFGEGEIDFPAVLEALEGSGYNGGVHVELSRHSHDAVNTARNALEFLQGIWPGEMSGSGTGKVIELDG